MTDKAKLQIALLDAERGAQHAQALIDQQATEIERLQAALQRIDGINDNPACFNPMIEEVLRAALEPKP